MTWLSSEILGFNQGTGEAMKKKPQIKSDTKLNPQPEPPGPAKLERSGINPQPEPPKNVDARVQLNPQPEPPSPKSKIDRVTINPQPEPPKSVDARVMLNPQPEPPSPARFGKLKAIKIVSLLGAIGLGVVGFYFTATSLLPAIQILQEVSPIGDAAAIAQAGVTAALIPTLVTLIPAGALLVVGIAVKAH